MRNLEGAKDCYNFSFIEGDVRNEEDLEEAIEGVDAVFHEAAITSVPFSMENPTQTHEVNVEGTVNVLNKSIEEGVKRFIFASSCAVYGKPTDLPISEDASLNPLSPYAESKLIAERKCKNYGKRYDLETVILRYFNVYGLRQGYSSYAGVIMEFLDQLNKGKAPVIYGDGNQTRDFVNVSDVVRANILALPERGINSEEFNIGSGRSISINELCETLLRIMGKTDLKPIYEESREGDIRHSRADISKSYRVLGYKPKIFLEEGLRDLLKRR